MSQFGVTLKNTSLDVTIEMDKSARYRVLPKNEFDDKGNIKPLKPDKRNDPNWKLGGVKGKFSDVETGQWAIFKLRRNKAGTRYIADIVVVLGSEEAGSGK